MPQLSITPSITVTMPLKQEAEFRAVCTFPRRVALEPFVHKSMRTAQQLGATAARSHIAEERVRPHTCRRREFA